MKKILLIVGLIITCSFVYLDTYTYRGQGFGYTDNAVHTLFALAGPSGNDTTLNGRPGFSGSFYYQLSDNRFYLYDSLDHKFRALSWLDQVTLQEAMTNSSILTRSGDIEYPYLPDSFYAVNFSGAVGYGSLFLSSGNSNIGVVTENGTFAGTNTLYANTFSNGQVTNEWTSGITSELLHNGNTLDVFDTTGHLTFSDSSDGNGHYFIVATGLKNTDSRTFVQADANGILHNTPVYSPYTIFTPSNGGSVSLNPGQNNIINPATSLSSVDIGFPAGERDGQTLQIKFEQNITLVNTSGSVVVPITSATAGQYFLFVWSTSTNQWY